MLLPLVVIGDLWEFSNLWLYSNSLHWQITHTHKVSLHESGDNSRVLVVSSVYRSRVEISSHAHCAAPVFETEYARDTVRNTPEGAHPLNEGVSRKSVNLAHLRGRVERKIPPLSDTFS